MTQDGHIQSVERAVDMVDLLVAHEAGMRLKELADALGVQSPTARNLLRTLEARRLVAREGRRYIAGPILTEWATALASRDWMARCGKAMKTVSARHPAAVVTLAQAVGAAIRVRLRISPDRPGILQRPADTVFGVYTSISALVLQAYSGDEQVAELRRFAPFLEYGSHLWKSEARLDDFVTNIRRQGWGAMPFDRERWLRLAVPVWQPGGHLAGVMGISLPIEGEPPDPAQVARYLNACANHTNAE